MNLDLKSISPLAAYLDSFLSYQIPMWLLVLLAVAVHWFLLLMPAVVALNFIDRKLGADIQMRIGPNRVPISGSFQFLGDTIKLLFKEDASTTDSNPWLFKWGAIIAIICLFAAIGSIPAAESWALSNVDSGAFTVLFAMIFAHLCQFWAAYAASNRWSVLSAFRILPLVGSYLVPLMITLVPVVLITGSANLDSIVRAQGGMPWRWILFHNPGTLLAGATMFVALLIWQGRVPFDHYFAEGEISGGYAGEYSGLRKGFLTFLEYASVVLALGLIVTVYLGGWQTPFDLESFGRASNLVEWLVFSTKAFVLAFFYIWIRWSLPRLRVDQMITLSWRILVPMGLAGTIVSALWLVIFNGKGIGDFL